MNRNVEKMQLNQGISQTLSPTTKELRWKPKQLDLGLSVAIALLFPIIAQFLYLKTGALIPMLFYYGLAWGLSKWRRGSTGYFNKLKLKVPVAFYINVGIILLSVIFAYFARTVDTHSTFSGVLLTALIWAPLNAASEQLLWIYIFESWDLYRLGIKEDKIKKENTFIMKILNNHWFYRIVGLLLFSIFVGTIHTMYWTKFLHTTSVATIFGIIFVLCTTLSGFLHLIVWRKSNQMIFTFIPHFLLNLIPLFWTSYSILPYLWN
ncbi:MAG: hypothetical protein ACTSVU_02605 [Promethearchaeota archaeon]